MNESGRPDAREDAPPALALAVIGLDGTGEAFARAGMLHAGFRLVTVADPRAERGAVVAHRLGVPFAPAYLDVLNDPTLDGLVVAGDVADRSTILAEAAVRGRTVLAMAPPAGTLTRLDDLILTSLEGGARIACPNPWRVVPAMVLAERQLREPGIGQPLAVFAAHRTKAATGDPLVELGLPLLDYLVGAIRSEVVQVQATSAMLFGAAGQGEPDTWLLLLRFRTGLIATVELGRSLPAAFPTDSEVRVEFVGSERVVVAEAENLGVTTYARDGSVRRDESGPDAHRALLDGFLPAVREAQAPEESLVTLRWVMPLIEAARRSASEGAPIAMTRW